VVQWVICPGDGIIEDFFEVKITFRIAAKSELKTTRHLGELFVAIRHIFLRVGDFVAYNWKARAIHDQTVRNLIECTEN
jgi:hypothetical protein